MVYFNASPSTLQTEPKFIEMDNIIHLDEKWYNATKKVTCIQMRMSHTGLSTTRMPLEG
jgi:hypothetical protein